VVLILSLYIYIENMLIVVSNDHTIYIFVVTNYKYISVSVSLYLPFHKCNTAYACMYEQVDGGTAICTCRLYSTSGTLVVSIYMYVLESIIFIYFSSQQM